MTDLTIIMVSYNTKNITKKCLETVQKSLKTDPTIKYEIIIIDNSSTDGSPEMLKKVKDQPRSNRGQIGVECIFNKQNFGFSKANNQAAKVAKGQYLLFLNSDIEVINDAIPKLYNFFKSQDKFHFLGGKLFEKDGKTPQPSCGPFYSLPVVFGALFLKGDYWGLTRYSPENIREVDWVSGACFITQKEFFQELKGFDENIFMYMEEHELFFRAKRAGLKVGFYNQSEFIHLASASSSGRTQPILQVYKGFIFFYKKHHSRFDCHLLSLMLILKALISIIFGKLTNSQYLIKTYEQAYKLVKNS